MADLRAQIQQALASRGQQSAAAVSPVASFSDWGFYGSESLVAVEVTITPTSASYSINTAVILLQSRGEIICYSSLSTANAGNGWSVTLGADSQIHDVGQNGPSVQAQAFAQVNGVGYLWSPVQTYTVS